VKGFLLTACLVLGSSMTAGAQDVPQWEIFGGYSFLGTNLGGQDQQHANGWHASIAENQNSWFGGVAEFSGHYADQIFVLRPLGATESENFNAWAYSILLGPQVSFRKLKSVNIFGHYLIGLVHARANEVAFSQPFTDTKWAHAIGFGVDKKTRNKQVAIRIVQVDFLMTHFVKSINKEAQDNWRISGGVVLRLGHK
jgi:hypothetical protein